VPKRKRKGTRCGAISTQCSMLNRARWPSSAMC
jgi:hypothetical protein